MAKQSIPMTRLILYILIAALIPAVAVSYHFVAKKKEWMNVSEEIQNLQFTSQMKERKQAINKRVRAHYEGGNEAYLKTHLAPLKFLSKEKAALNRLIENPTYTGNETAEKRYAFLSGKENKVHFQELSALTGEGIIETVEGLTHPVEVDGGDLKEILRRIEGAQKDKPQLLITDFHLKKLVKPDGNEVYALDLTLLQREFIQ